MLTIGGETEVDELAASSKQPIDVGAAAGKENPAACSGLPWQAKIMMVDDERLDSLVVAEYLKTGGYRDLIYTVDPLAALPLAAAERPDALLLDIHMPRLSGLEILQRVRDDDALARTPVVILTASTDDDDKLWALQLGATDFLHKPIHGGELLARLRNILMAKAFQDQCQNHSKTLETAVRQRTAELEASRRELIDCLARAAEYRDDDTGRHAIRVGRYARIIGRRLGMREAALDDLEQAAKLHDVGKIGIPDAVLLKPGKLTPEEFDVMQEHCNIGKRIIERMPEDESCQLRRHAELGAKILELGCSPILDMAMRIAFTHHECWDGTGYPRGLAGEDIPLEGRITAVADVFDALSSKRDYKPAFPLKKCFSIMQKRRGTQFDPRVLDAFLARCDDIIQVQIAYADVK
jgi:putative two-component system response regulator